MRLFMQHALMFFATATLSNSVLGQFPADQPVAQMPHPKFGGIRMETFWQCSGCKREMGRDAHPPPQCPHCGALIANNPGNENVASATGIVVIIVVLVILLVIVIGAIVVVVNGGKLGMMKKTNREEQDLPIVGGIDGDGTKRSRKGGKKPPSYEL